jgi:hypothetical protein
MNWIIEGIEFEDGSGRCRRRLLDRRAHTFDGFGAPAAFVTWRPAQSPEREEFTGAETSG